LANGAAHIVGSIPGLPDLAGEMIISGSSAYSRAPGEKAFSTTAVTNLSYNPADKTSGPVSVVNTILGVVADASLSPQLLGIVQEPYGSCYHIQVQVTPDVVKSKLSVTGTGIGSTVVDLWIYQSDFYVERVEFKMADPTAGSAAIRLVLSNYNKVSPIAVPPASEMATGLPAPAAT
jgi:hypothetical protein